MGILRSNSLVHGVLYAMAEQGGEACRGSVQALCSVLQRGRDVRPEAPKLPGLLSSHLSPCQRGLHSAGECAATGCDMNRSSMRQSWAARGRGTSPGDPVSLVPRIHTAESCSGTLRVHHHAYHLLQVPLNKQRCPQQARSV